MKSNLLLILSLLLFFFGSTHASDSLRTEVVNGKKVIVHRVEQGQTLFALARKYNTNVNEIKLLNPSLSQLQTGMEVLVPDKRSSSPKEAIPMPSQVAVATMPAVATPNSSKEETHTVQQGETLYRIAKLYGVSTQELADANKIGNSGVKLGQELKIPRKEAVTKSNDSAPISSIPPPVDNSKSKSEKKTSASGYPAITESGNAVLDASIASSPFFLVLHKTAPINTLLIIKNRENGNSVHVKVIGNLKSSGLDATVVAVNKLVYEKLEAKTSTFPVELFYTPEE